MNLPIDEMLSELRSALEAYDLEQSDENLDSVYRETSRIDRACENELDMED